jgi:hypothetical protein
MSDAPYHSSKMLQIMALQLAFYQKFNGEMSLSFTGEIIFTLLSAD